MLIWVLGLAVAVALLRGGRPRPDVHIHKWWLVPLALSFQLLAFLVPGTRLGGAMMVGSFLALVYCLLLNARVQSLRIVLLGVLLNMIVLLVNGGRLPVDMDAAQRAGVDVSAVVANRDPRHIPASDTSHLSFLGDVIPMRWPVARVLSVGDVFLFLGIFLLVQDVMGKRVAIGVSTGES